MLNWFSNIHSAIPVEQFLLCPCRIPLIDKSAYPIRIDFGNFAQLIGGSVDVRIYLAPAIRLTLIQSEPQFVETFN